MQWCRRNDYYCSCVNYYRCNYRYYSGYNDAGTSDAFPPNAFPPNAGTSDVFSPDTETSDARTSDAYALATRRSVLLYR